MKNTTLVKYVLLLVTIFAFANAGYAAGWSPSYNVTKIDVDETRVQFRNDSGYANPDNCPAGNLFITFDNKAADRALKIALIAKEKGYQVQFYLNGCTNAGYIYAVGLELH